MIVFIAAFFLGIGFVVGLCFTLTAFIPKIKGILQKYPIVGNSLAIIVFILVFMLLAWLEISYTIFSCLEQADNHCSLYLGDNRDLDNRVMDKLFFHAIVPPSLRSQICFIGEAEVCNRASDLLEIDPSWSAWDMYIAIVLAAIFAAVSNIMLVGHITKDKLKRSA